MLCPVRHYTEVPGALAAVCVHLEHPCSSGNPQCPVLGSSRVRAASEGPRLAGVGGGPKLGWAVSEVTGGRPVLCKYCCCNMAGLNGPMHPSIIAEEQKPPLEHGGPAVWGMQTQAACALLINCLFSFCLSHFRAPHREQLSVLSLQPLPQPSPHHFRPSFSSLLSPALKKMEGKKWG